MGTEMDKKKAAEVVWLGYFNEYLFERGLIDEAMRKKLKIKISITAKNPNTHIETVEITRDEQVVLMGTALLSQLRALNNN
ncbi:hypothetical protein [Butyricicoccus sp.]